MSRAEAPDFAWLVRRHEDDILNYFRYARPCIHSCEKPFLLNAPSYRHHGRNYGPLNEWLSELARVIVQSHLGRGRDTHGVAASPEETTDDARRHALSEREREQLKAAIQALPSAERLVLQLHDLQNFSYREIARGLNVPRGTVHSRAARGRRRLRHILANYTHDAGVSENATEGQDESEEGTSQ